MSARKISFDQLRAAIGLTVEETVQLLRGERRITASLAALISQTLGLTSKFWVDRDQQYLDDVAKLQAEGKGWVRSLPIADMVRYGWVSGAAEISEKIRTAFDFFGVTSVDEWRTTWMSDEAGLTAFRSSPVFAADAASIATWLRQGELEAQSIRCKPWSSDSFAKSLPDLKRLSRLREPDRFIPALTDACANHGVAFVVVRTPRGCPASGATRFLSAQKAVLQVSFRYLSDDHFWFTFFHECAHLLLHEGRLFLENGSGGLQSIEEEQANAFAADLLVPPQWRDKLSTVGTDPKRVLRLAHDLGISPGILVGQLQHLGLVRRDRLNYLKRRFEWPKA
ncbi:ImmA/IrrE family metallo-endopeptidase [Variovorax boronicumulans]|uniref:ImmA/IrrE family metallo-endopeptidase n=1 Tax=Variovorax boronicumulans TaxID=436515 RepID=UPI00147123D2|nr:ImmA/IrrE family metallo-endopeptidase [Variovorax boronicumulans]